MTDVPETRFARSPDGTRIAYQITGDGLLDLVVLGGGAIPIDLLWEDPGFTRFVRRLGAFCRTIWFEMRGWGASGGNPQDSLDAEIFNVDVISVLDAMNADRVALMGW